jgi:hypothetical protein
VQAPELDAWCLLAWRLDSDACQDARLATTLTRAAKPALLTHLHAPHTGWAARRAGLSQEPGGPCRRRKLRHIVGDPMDQAG